MKMKISPKLRALLRCAAGALALSMLLAGCSPYEQNTLSTEGPQAEPAMGRYTETQRALPEGLGKVASFCKNKEGQLEIVYNKDKSRNVGPWYMAVSQDNGAAWQEKPAPWLQEVGESSFNFLSYDAVNGGYTAQITRLPQGFLEMTSEEQAAFMESGWVPEVQLFYVDSTGAMGQPKEVDLSAEDGLSASSLVIAPNGDVFTNNYFSVIQWDSAMKTRKFTYAPQAFSSVTSFCVVEDKLYMACGGEILQYDTTTGQQLENFASVSATAGEANASGHVFVAGTQFGDRLLSYEPQSSAIYYCDSTGIYCRKVNGSAVEKLAEGQFTSLNMPSEIPVTLIGNPDGSCFILMQGEKDVSLMYYSFDKTVPTVPGVELKVYSLEENKTVRQAMSLFQRSNPNVRVNYQVGLSSGITRSNALRTLSTEILSGQGPDIIVLDNMPVASYVEKGVLMDLSGLPIIEELLPNVANSLQKDGKVYGLPARFSIPLLVAEGESDITGLASLAQAIVQWQGANPNKAGIDESLKTPDGLINCLYTTCAPAWFTPEGALDTAAFTEFLENVKKITDLYPQQGLEESSAYVTMDITGAAVNFFGGNMGFCLGEVLSFTDLSVVDAAITQKGAGEFQPLPGQVQGVFTPKVIAGINAATAQEETAKAFLQLLLSQQVQDYDFNEGFPTNAASFEKQSQNPYPEYDDGMYISVGNGDGVAYDLQAKWPEEAFLSQFKAMAAGLNLPQTVDADIMEILLTETPPYFAGEKTVEETVAAVAQKVQLYLAE